MITGKVILPINIQVNHNNTNISQIIKQGQNQINYQQNLQQFLTELFTKDGREPNDVEFVDDDSEEMLNKYGFFFHIFTVIFILMAIHSLFFYDKK
jgi:hypothetical protein